MFAIDFWRFQLSLLKAHDSLQQSQLENFAEIFLKIFPIDFQSLIDFSELHMIRPLGWKSKQIRYVLMQVGISRFNLMIPNFAL